MTDPQLIADGPEGIRMGLHICGGGMPQLCLYKNGEWLTFTENESEHLYDLCRAWQRQFRDWEKRSNE